MNNMLHTDHQTYKYRITLKATTRRALTKYLDTPGQIIKQRTFLQDEEEVVRMFVLEYNQCGLLWNGPYGQRDQGRDSWIHFAYGITKADVDTHVQLIEIVEDYKELESGLWVRRTKTLELIDWRGGKVGVAYVFPKCCDGSGFSDSRIS